jgi:predicted transcriptional regulator
MLDKELISKLIKFKEENSYTLYDLSKKLDIQVTTIERWLQTRHINKIYAKLVRERLGLD